MNKLAMGCISASQLLLQQYTDFNINYDDGADSDGDVRPFFDAVEGEDDYDFDNDAELVWLEPEQLPEPLAQTGTTQETTSQMTEQHLMLLSNSELKEESRRQNLSASGNKKVLVQRLLTLIKPIVAGARPSLPPSTEQNVNEAQTIGKSGNPPPAGG